MHTVFCDGYAKPEDYVLKAIELNMKSIGFSGHAPLHFPNDWAMKEEKLEDYVNELIRLKNKYKNDIPIYIGIEADYIPGVVTDANEIKKKYNLDYIIGSIHLVGKDDINNLWFIDGPIEDFDEGIKKLFNNDVKKAVEAYFKQTIEMINFYKPDIIGHLDKIKMNNKNRFFNEEEDWYKELVYELIDCIVKNDVIIEINTRGIYKKKVAEPFPSFWIIKYASEKGAKFIINSDTHKPDEIIMEFDNVYNNVKNLGINKLYNRVKNKWEICS